MPDSAPAEPEPGPPGRMTFQTVFGKTAVVVANLTAVVVFFRALPTLLKEAPRLGWREATVQFLLLLTLQSVIASVVNTFVVALPLAGAIYYFRFLAQRR